MKLLYIWIENFKCLNHVEMNFSEKISFRYSANKLNKSTKSDYSIFSENESGCINNISAIIGANGSGKTTILKLLYEVFYNNFSESKYIIIYEINNKNIMRTNVNDIDYDNTNLELESNSSQVPFNIIYYSPYFDHTKNNFSNQNVQSFYDVSTNSLLDKDFKTWSSFNERNNGTYDIVHAHHVMEYNRYIDFLYKSLQKPEFNILRKFMKLPQKVVFELNHSNIKMMLKEINDDIIKLYFDRICELSEQSNNNKIKFIANLFVVLINYLINKISPQNRALVLKNYRALIYTELNKDITLENIGVTLDKIITLLECETDTAEIIIHFFRFLFSVSDSNFDNGTLFFNTTDDINMLNIFYIHYMTTDYMLKDYLDFGIDVSSGEIAEITLYSRLFNILWKIKNNNSNKIYNTLIFLDDIDIALHPSQQRMLVSNLISFFNILKENTSLKFQIVLSTHSPIILSDIPASNTVMLVKNDNDNYSEVKTELPETFGANIYTLFSKAFFMDDKITGSFSEKIINNALEYLSKCAEEQQFSNIIEIPDSLKYKLQLIGDELLKDIVKGWIDNDSNNY